MADIILKGRLNLKNDLKFASKVLIGDAKKEALVELGPAGKAHSEKATPVMQPPPPVGPATTGTKVWVLNSLNQTVKANGVPLVTMGMAMQGDVPLWPGMVLPSTNNAPPNAVTVNFLAINVQGDSAIIFPSGSSASLDTSGQ